MACEAKSLDQNDARFTSSRQGFGSGRALSVIVQPVFEFHHSAPQDDQGAAR